MRKFVLCLAFLLPSLAQAEERVIFSGVSVSGQECGLAYTLDEGEIGSIALDFYADGAWINLAEKVSNGTDSWVVRSQVMERRPRWYTTIVGAPIFAQTFKLTARVMAARETPTSLEVEMTPFGARAPLFVYRCSNLKRSR